MSVLGMCLSAIDHNSMLLANSQAAEYYKPWFPASPWLLDFIHPMSSVTMESYQTTEIGILGTCRKKELEAQGLPYLNI